MTTFSTSAYRSFKTFVGELTATSVGIYVAVEEAIPSVDALDAEDRWSTVAERHGIKVSGLSSERVRQSTIRLILVSLYSGFDLFIGDLRGQHNHLHGKAWIQHDGDSPFQALARNTPSLRSEHEDRLGPSRIATLDYYRLARNAVAHPRPEAIAAASAFFAANHASLESVKDLYKLRSAPNSVGDINIHDIRFLARVALDVAKAIDQDFDPGDERLTKLVPHVISKTPQSVARARREQIGWLRTNFGVSAERATLIVGNVSDSSA